MLLGVIFVFNATIWNVFVAWFAANIANRLGSNSAIGRFLKKLIAVIFIGFGVRLALSIPG